MHAGLISTNTDTALGHYASMHREATRDLSRMLMCHILQLMCLEKKKKQILKYCDEKYFMLHKYWPCGVSLLHPV